MASKGKRYYHLIGCEPEGYVSEIGAHRYLLSFRSKKSIGGKRGAIIQMNGSIAGYDNPNHKGWRIDPTIGKVLSWCYENEQTPIEFVYCLNLFSHVNPDPSNLSNLSLAELNNDMNDECIRRICKNVDYIILAYGDCEYVDEEIAIRRREEVMRWFPRDILYRVGDATLAGNPKHGRMWNHQPTLQVHREPLVSV